MIEKLITNGYVTRFQRLFIGAYFLFFREDAKHRLISLGKKYNDRMQKFHSQGNQRESYFAWMAFHRIKAEFETRYHENFIH
jgi:hypothetical protein